MKKKEKKAKVSCKAKSVGKDGAKLDIKVKSDFGVFKCSLDYKFASEELIDVVRKNLEVAEETLNGMEVGDPASFKAYTEKCNQLLSDLMADISEVMEKIE